MTLCFDCQKYKDELIDDSKEQTLLTHIAKCGHLDCCKVAVASGAKINANTYQEPYKSQPWLVPLMRTYCYESPLSIAIRNNHFEICHVLLDHGAKVWASDILSLIGLKKTDVLIKAYDGRFDERSQKDIIEKCCKLNYHEICQHLIDKELHVYEHDMFEVLNCAVEYSISCLKILWPAWRERVLKSEVDSQLYPFPLHRACTLNKYEVCKYLIENGCDVNKESRYHGYAIEQTTDPNIVLCLIERGARKHRSGGFMHLAYKTKHEKLLSTLFKIGVDVNYRNSWDCQTVLHLACNDDNMEMVEKLFMNSKVNPNCEDFDGNTPLHIAYTNGNLELIQYLIHKGATVDQPNKLGHTILHLACKDDDLKMVEKLFLNDEVDPNCKDYNGDTPLHLACSNGNLDLVKYLIYEGAIVNQQNNAGQTPLHVACTKLNLELINYLLANGADVNYKEPLPIASNPNRGCKRNSRQKSQRRKPETQPNKKNLKLITPLHTACSLSSVDIVEILLEHGANVNDTDPDGTTPLHIACLNGNTNIVERLLKSGSRINLRTRGPNTRVKVYKQRHTRVSTVKMDGCRDSDNPIVNFGSRKKNTSLKQCTPLHNAVIGNHAEIVKLLIQGNPKTNRKGIAYRGGAKVEAVDNNNDTPLHYAIEHGANECLALLLSAGSKVCVKSLHLAIKYNRLEMCQTLLTHDPSVLNKVNDRHQTIMYEVNNVEFGRIFINGGSKLNVIDVDGNTPLHHHIVQGNTNMINLILTACVDEESRSWIDAVNNRGNTPLHLAVAAGNADICELLLKFRADHSVKDTLGHTPLDYIVKRKHIANRERIIAMLRPE